ncbi:MAG: S41 family peptidase [Bacteroidaceae bacterium]|nr:S41 family peptidase [Bacteroidaceae bacterium]
MRVIRVIFCYSLLAAVLFSSCVREDEFDDTPEGNLEALWQIIDQRYCFLDYKAETIGLDWDAALVKYRQRLNPKMTRLQLFQVLCDMLAELQDGHVNLFSSADMGRFWSWKENYPLNLNDQLRDSYLGQDYRIGAGVKYRILEDNIGYVVYESFTAAAGEGNLSDMLYYLRLCDGLILDVRGNSGGALTYSSRLASHFTNEKILVGYTCHKTGPGHNDFSSPEAEYLEPSDGVRWQKPVVVLTNRECFSATNTFVRDMRQCPHVTILGDRTGGGSGLPFNSELPSGWGVRFSACPMFDAQMNQIEFGIAPDLYCSLTEHDVQRGKDTLIETAREIIRRE